LTASRDDRSRLKLPAQRRLRQKAQFEAVYASGKRFGDGFFSVIMRSNDTGRPRLGMAVSTKTAGNSVERNRIRRLIRESFRLHQHDLPAKDVIVSARARVRGATNAELRASLEALWNRMAAPKSADRPTS
jgi:ribonuclease P protein component